MSSEKDAVPVLALAACSLLVSSVERIIKKWRNHAQLLDEMKAGSLADVYRENAEELRAELARATERQPEENTLLDQRAHY